MQTHLLNIYNNNKKENKNKILTNNCETRLSLSSVRVGPPRPNKSIRVVTHGQTLLASPKERWRFRSHATVRWGDDTGIAHHTCQSNGSGNLKPTWFTQAEVFGNAHIHKQIGKSQNYTNWSSVKVVDFNYAMTFKITGSLRSLTWLLRMVPTSP